MLERRWIKWGLLLMGWTLLGLFAATRLKLSYFYSGQPITWRSALILALTDWYVWAALSPLIIWLARRFPLEPQSWRRGLLIQLPAGVFLSIFKMTLEFFVRGQLAPDFARRFPSLEFYSTLFTDVSPQRIVSPFPGHFRLATCHDALRKTSGNSSAS